MKRALRRIAQGAANASQFAVWAFILTIVLIPKLSWSAKGDWGEFCRKAELVVIGTLRNVERNVRFSSSEYEFKGGTHEFRAYFDRGIVEVEKVLRGDLATEGLYVIWYSRTYIYPGRRAAWSDADTNRDEGLRGIWIVVDTSDRLKGSHRPIFVPMEGLPRVEAILSGSKRNIYR